jgi:hypothetical protein
MSRKRPTAARPRTKRILGRENTGRKPPIAASREITVDDVIKDLLDLFKYLGIDATHLVGRVKGLDTTTVAQSQLHQHASSIGELLTLWHQDPKYLDDAGNPSPIKMLAARRSFRNLADRAVPNIGAKQILDELAKVGAVSIDAKGFIHAHMRSLPVYEDKRLAIQHTLISLDGFIKTLRHNLNSAPSNSDQLFHRIAWNGNFDPKQIPRLKIWVKKHGQNFLETTDNWMMMRSKPAIRDSKRLNKSVQLSVGVYLAVERLKPDTTTH